MEITAHGPALTAPITVFGGSEIFPKKTREAQHCAALHNSTRIYTTMKPEQSPKASFLMNVPYELLMAFDRVTERLGLSRSEAVRVLMADYIREHDEPDVSYRN